MIYILSNSIIIDLTRLLIITLAYTFLTICIQEGVCNENKFNLNSQEKCCHLWQNFKKFRTYVLLFVLSFPHRNKEQKGFN